MSAIYKEIVLSWEGKQYNVHPSFRMVQRIEATGISIMGVVTKINSGNPPFSQIAEIVAFMLFSAGCNKVRTEDIYAYLTRCDNEEWLRVTTAVTLAFIPEAPAVGNSEGLEDGADSTSSTTENPSPT